MPSQYLSNRVKVQIYINDTLVGIIRNRDLSLEKTKIYISDKLKVSPKLVEEIIRNAGVLGRIKIEGDVLTISDTEIVDYLKETKPADAEAEVRAIFDDHKSGTETDNPKP